MLAAAALAAGRAVAALVAGDLAAAAGGVAPESFSRAAVLSWMVGLIGWGERISSSLLRRGESALPLPRFPTGLLLSMPDWELTDPCLALRERTWPGFAAVDKRPLSVRAGAAAVLGAAAADTCRAGLGAGIGGGAMEVRLAVTDGRGLAPKGGFALDGVLVRDGAVLDGAVPSCLVGDLVGDWGRVRLGHAARSQGKVALTLIALDGRDGLGTGLGLGAFRLFRLTRPESAGPERAEADENTLLGCAVVFLAAAGLGGGGGGWASTVTVVGRTNMP